MKVSSFSCVRILVCRLCVVIAVASCTTKERSTKHHLSEAASPYLREHADNPVAWYEWGDEALNKAKDENKLLVISIGYASCHWCHVMEEESFMDSAVAKIMNERFICIKVDREERPDIDQVYINAASVMSGNTGWPLNAFALPDGQPFHTVTYLPKTQWLALLEKIADTYTDDKGSVEALAQSVKNEVVSSDALFAIAEDQRPFTSVSVAKQIELWLPELDFLQGGLQNVVKFPLPVISELFLQNYFLNDHKISRTFLETTLNAMAKGGIYDQLGGGFSRYTTDEKWKVPHYEKMLYDNGQLLSLYAHAYQVTQDPLYVDIVNETATFVERELASGDGAFYSSINADSEGEEGKYYKWSVAQIRDALNPKDAAHAIRYFGLNTSSDTLRQALTAAQDEHGTLNHIKQQLFAARKHRIRPTTDKKIIVAWNAIMVTGLVDAFKATSDTLYLNQALQCAGFVQQNMFQADSSLQRSSFENLPGTMGFLEDYAWMSKAAIDLYQVTFDIRWLNFALALAEKALVLFDNPNGEFLFFTSEDMSNPVTRSTEIFDSVIPSSNTLMAEVLFKLGTLFNREHWVARAQSMTAGALTADPGQGIHLAGWAMLAQKIAQDPFEVAITGTDAIKRANWMQRQYLPHAIFLGGGKEDLPLLENKLIAGKTVYYVCRNKVCKLPTEDIEQALKQLEIN